MDDVRTELTNEKTDQFEDLVYQFEDMVNQFEGMVKHGRLNEQLLFISVPPLNLTKIVKK
jgi:hypothetical protein